MLAERLGKEWRARASSDPVHAAMTFTRDGLILGAGTVLAPACADDRAIRLEGHETRLLTLLSAAHLRSVDSSELGHIRRAALRWSEGATGLAGVHLALSRVNQLEQPGAAQRLFLADGLMQAGIEPEAILKALDLDPSVLEPLAKDYQEQPRVPKGSGRPSGQWTDGGAGGDQSDGGAASPDHGAHLVPVKYVARDMSVGRSRLAPSPDPVETPPGIVAPIAGRPWFVGLTTEQLGELALFTTRFAGPVVALGTVFIPSNKSLSLDGTIAGWPPIHFRWRTDQRRIVFSYLASNLHPVTTTAELGPDGLFRDVDRNVIGRVLPGGGVVIDRAAILPKEVRGKDEPNLCPKPIPDKNHGNLNGLRYENYMKALVNPGNPTPSKFGIGLPDPSTRNEVMFDDCQRRSDILFDYKGPTYTWLLSTSFKNDVLYQMVEQAKRQLRASDGRHIIWVFEEESAKEAVEKEFDDDAGLKDKIQFESEPMPGFSI